MSDKTSVARHLDLLGLTGLNAKSITGLEYWQHGATHVIEINYTGGPYYIKLKQHVVEYGGTSDWNTGTRF